jgi:regulator of sigma E protease
MEQQLTSVLTGTVGMIIVLGTIIFIHELGHFLVARWSGMMIHEFSMGFGPALFSRVRKGTRYSIRAIPLGGYVRIAGMDPGEEQEENGFYSKPFFPKFATILAGVTMNFVLALFIFILIGMTLGYPNVTTRARVDSVQEGTPAAKAGIHAGDLFLNINGVSNPSVEQAREALHATKQQARVVIDRQGKQLTFTITPMEVPSAELVGTEIKVKNIKVIGVVLLSPLEKLSPMASVREGANQLSEKLRYAVANIRYLVSGKARFRDIGGPLVVMRASYEVSKNALSSREQLMGFLSTLALFSVLIGFFNLLPLPALDGGHLATIASEEVYKRFTGKEFNRERVVLIHMIGMIVLLAFVAAVTVSNIVYWNHIK